MNNHFTEVTKQLNLKMGVLSHSKPLENITNTFKSHESIHMIMLATSTALEFFDVGVQQRRKIRKKF